MSVAGSVQRPRVSRETRRLLGVAAIALLTLWGLGRLRFPDAPVAPNPVPPLLAQLAPPARFSELAAELGAASARVQDALVVVPLHGDNGLVPTLALRTGPGVAATVLRRATPSMLAAAADALVMDRPSGLTLVATSRPEPVSPPRSWEPASTQAGQFLVAAVPAPGDGIGVAPVFLSSWASRWSPAWNGPVWRTSNNTGLAAGTFLFSASGELAGVVVTDGGAPAVVPASTLYTAVESLMAAANGAGTGWLGLSIVTLTPRLAAAAAAESGVLVIAVERGSPADGAVKAGDVITHVNGVAVTGSDSWSAIVDRRRPGEDLLLRVLSNGASRDVKVTTAPFPPAPVSSLGMRLRRTAGRTEVVSVEPGSSAAAAGLRPGDVITKAGVVIDPTPADVAEEFGAESDAPLLVLFTRDGTPAAVALER